MLTTTFKLLRKHSACKDRYTVLRNALNRGDNDPITLVEILDSNGLEDALWALPAVPNEQTAERDKLARMFACWCVRQVWHLLTDERSRHAVEVAERYVAGKASYYEVLEAQQQLFPAQNALAQTQLNQLLAVVQLYKALGGGWETDAPPTP